MSDTFDLILKNGTVVTPSGLVETDVAVKGGRIADIGNFGSAKAREIIDCKGLHILPGVIDTQVHFREPGPTHKEDLATGTLGAIAGGVTTIFEMPNTDPLTITDVAMTDKLNRAKGRAFCDYAFFMGGCAENAPKLAALERMEGCCGVKVFMGSSTGSLLASEDNVILSILQNGQRRVAIHAEDEARLKERKHIVEKSGNVAEHHVWRDVETAVKATNRVLKLARRAGRNVHILHVTTADEMQILAQHKDIATVETTPQHLTFFAPDCYESIGTRAQMNPPIRTKDHMEGLWRAINDGTVDVLGSDHAPHTLEEKAKPYPSSPSGMTGVQTTVPVMLDHVNAGRLSLLRLVDLLCHGPQRIFQIANKGRIARGYDADFTIVDLKRQKTITDRWIKSKSAWTPYDGKKVTGWVQGTVLRGVPVMWDDEIPESVSAKPPGMPVSFLQMARQQDAA
jgi:dihydroorotase